MKRVLLLSLMSWSVCLADGPPKVKDGFLAAVKSAYEAQDVKRVKGMIWEEGMSDFDRNQEEQMLAMMVYNSGVVSAQFDPLPADFMDINVGFGRKTELTHAADGIITVNLKPSDKNPNTSVSMPYALISGTYYLVTVKTTDLGWKGPDDKTLKVTVDGDGKEKVKIHLKYNASGVDIERDQKDASEAFPGQYIDTVSVKSDSGDANVTLEVDANDKPIYKSKPLVGKGEIEYKKGESK